ncbi:MAG: TldD/PmbA family protein [Nitrospirae bacterium]|nr:MAG: TldD/PmbA family protein [Nitrospirota bacterium]
MKTDLNLAEDILREALSRGATEAEVYMFASKGLSVDVKDQEVEALEGASDWGYAVRVLKGKSQGFSYSNTKENWKQTVQAALEAADITPEDRFNGFCPPEDGLEVDIYDPEVTEINPEKAIQWAMEIEKICRDTDRRIKKTRKSSVSTGEAEVLLVNSLGLNKSYRATSVDAQIVVAAEEDGEAQMGWGWMGGRSLKEVDLQRIGLDAARRATQLLGARKATTTQAAVILESSTVAELFGVLAGAFSSENVQKGKSFLAGKTDERVGSEALEIIDSGLLPWRTGSRPFDAEGIPSKETILVKEGILRGYLYNLYTARKSNTVSTSSAVRSGIYSPPSVGISNLLIRPSSEDYVKPLEELIRKIKKGMVVTEVMGVHTANPVTGEFSIGASGLWVENGEISYPVREAAISGTLLELLRKTVAFSNEVRFYGRIGSSDLLIEGINISG